MSPKPNILLLNVHFVVTKFLTSRTKYRMRIGRQLSHYVMDEYLLFWYCLFVSQNPDSLFMIIMAGICMMHVRNYDQCVIDRHMI